MIALEIDTEAVVEDSFSRTASIDASQDFPHGLVVNPLDTKAVYVGETRTGELIHKGKCDDQAFVKHNSVLIIAQCSSLVAIRPETATTSKDAWRSRRFCRRCFASEAAMLYQKLIELRDSGTLPQEVVDLIDEVIVPDRLIRASDRLIAQISQSA